MERLLDIKMRLDELSTLLPLIAQAEDTQEKTEHLLAAQAQIRSIYLIIKSLADNPPKPTRPNNPEASA